jgi:predicted membrane protein
MREHHHRPGLWPGFLLVSLGAGLLARELGLLPAHVRVLDFWPLFVVMVGVSLLVRASGLVTAVLALAFLATGGLLLAGNLGFVTSSATRFWPVLLVLLGLWALFRRGPEPEPQGLGPELEPPYTGEDFAEVGTDVWSAGEQSTEQEQLIRQFTCAGAQLRVESQAWRGGKIGVTAGGVELDLRQARLAPQGAVLALRVFMGGVDIRVPDTWQVQLDVTPLLGGADDTTRSTQGAGTAPRLRIVGNVTLGGVTVQN